MNRFLIESETSPWYVILIVVIVLACLFLLFFITGWIFWAILLKIEKKVYVSFSNIIPLEDKRREILLSCIKHIKDKRYSCNKELLKEIEDKITPKFDNPKDAISVKDSMDFGVMYLTKILKTYGKSLIDDDFIKQMEEANKISYQEYEKFSKIAARYNAIFLMPSTKLVNKMHKKENRRTRISYM